MKHTPGPWVATRQSNEYGEHDEIIVASKHETIARIPAWQNAHLIAAAPTMLSALERAQNVFLKIPVKDKEAMEVGSLVYEAIAKAKGEL